MVSSDGYNNQLKTLDIGNNQLTDFPPSLLQNQLQYFYASNNMIKTNLLDLSGSPSYGQYSSP